MWQMLDTYFWTHMQTMPLIISYHYTDSWAFVNFTVDVNTGESRYDKTGAGIT